MLSLPNKQSIYPNDEKEVEENRICTFYIDKYTLPFCKSQLKKSEKFLATYTAFHGHSIQHVKVYVSHIIHEWSACWKQFLPYKIADNALQLQVCAV